MFHYGGRALVIYVRELISLYLHVYFLQQTPYCLAQFCTLSPIVFYNVYLFDSIRIRVIILFVCVLCMHMYSYVCCISLKCRDVH